MLFLLKVKYDSIFNCVKALFGRLNYNEVYAYNIIIWILLTNVYRTFVKHLKLKNISLKFYYNFQYIKYINFHKSLSYKFFEEYLSR